MRVIRTLATAAIITITAISGAGCGRQAAPHPELDSAFRAEANTVCARAVAIQTAHPFPLKDFNVKHPDRARLPILADYFSTYGQAANLARELNALGLPATHRNDWQHLLALIRQLSANATAQIAADRRRDVAAFHTTAQANARLTGRIDKLGRRLGFASTSACGHELG